MAEENISDERFKGEVMRILSNLVVKVDGLEGKVDVTTREIALMRSDVRTLSGQMAEIGQKLSRLINV